MTAIKLSPFSASPYEIFWKLYDVRTYSFRLQYQVTGPINKLSLPNSYLLTKSFPQDELWLDNCFELFVRKEHDHYSELNFSPEHHFAMYDFSSYRKRVARKNDLMIETKWEKEEESAIIDISVKHENDDLRKLTKRKLSPCAILYPKDGKPQYFAFKHCKEMPDFHALESFVDFSAMGIKDA